MDIDLPLEDVIKKSKNKGKADKRPKGNKGGKQSRGKQNAPAIPKQSTQRGGKIGKSYTSGTANGKGAAKKIGSAPKPRSGLLSAAAASKRGGLSTVRTSYEDTFV
jgi:hypothetical protein